MTDIVFMDIETLGLDLNAPIWEFAAVRRFEDGREASTEFLIRHDVAHWLDDFPAEFRSDYETRYNASKAVSERVAAGKIHTATYGAHIIGAVPSFDTERLAKLLRRNQLEPAWHYHLVDVENVVVGYLAGKGQLLSPPWKSDDLSAAIGVDAAAFPRHTAMGDVRWTMAQWDAVMSKAGNT
jgi:hypothetical protein